MTRGVDGRAPGVSDGHAAPYPAATMAWGPRDVRLYALAVGAPVDALDERDLSLVAPAPAAVLPTFAVLFTEAHSLRHVGLPGLDYSVHDVVYAGHDLVLHAPIPVEGRATTVSWVQEVRPVRTGAIVRRASLTRDPAGRPLATNVVTSLVRGARAVASVHDAPAGVEEAQDALDQLDGAPPGATDDLLALATSEVPPAQAVLYSLTGDENLLHLSPSVARGAGFERPIMQGLCVLAHAVQQVTRALGCAWSAVERVSARFVAPTFPGDRLVIAAGPLDDRSPVQFTCSVAGSEGADRPAVVGSIVFGE